MTPSRSATARSDAGNETGRRPCPAEFALPLSHDVEISRVQIGDRHVLQKDGVAGIDGDQRIFA